MIPIRVRDATNLARVGLTETEIKVSGKTEKQRLFPLNVCSLIIVDGHDVGASES